MTLLAACKGDLPGALHTRKHIVAEVVGVGNPFLLFWSTRRGPQPGKQARPPGTGEGGWDVKYNSCGDGGWEALQWGSVGVGKAGTLLLWQTQIELIPPV